MQHSSRPTWSQFSLRSLLLLMLVVATFFAGRLSLQIELNRLRAIELEARRAQEAAVAAERAALHQLLLAQVQASLTEAALKEVSTSTLSQAQELREGAQAELSLPKNLVEETAAPSN